MTTILDRSRIALCFVKGLRFATLIAIAAAGAATFTASDAAAKAPGARYCFNKVCHRVRTLAETQAMVGRTEHLATSFYDNCKRDRYNPCGLTSSGEVFRADRPDNAASPLYPDGTTLLVYHPGTRRAAVVRVNNAGPYSGNRKLDVSRATAEKLGFRDRGVARLQVRVLSAPTKAEATYRKRRRYKPVPGYVGQFASLDAAAGSLTAVAALTAVKTAMLAPISVRGKAAASGAPDFEMPRVTGASAPKPRFASVVEGGSKERRKRRSRTAFRF